MSLTKDYVYKNGKLYKISAFSTLYKNGDRLYKLFDKVFGIDLESLEYKQSLYDFVSPTIILPKDLIIDNEKTCGYEQKYISSYSLGKCIYKNIPFERKRDIINSLSNSLKEINQFLIVGDINLENILIPRNKLDNKGYLIDFDFAKKINAEHINLTAYNVKVSSDHIIDNLNTDKVKIFISFLSLLYGYNFEEIVWGYKCKDTLEVILEKLESFKNNGLLINYANYLNQCLKKGLPIEEYFHIPINYNLEKEIEIGRKLIKKR